MPAEPSLSKLYREYGDKWAIEPIPPGIRWMAVDRESGDDIRFVLAHEVGTLRFRLDRAKQEELEET